MTKVLFVSYGGGHVASCLPVAELLKRRGYTVDILALTTAREYVMARGWQPLGFKDFVESTDGDALKVGARLMMQEANGLVAREESEAYLGLNFLDLVAALGEAQAATVYAEKGRQAFLPVRTLKRILGRVQPQLLVTTCSPRSEFAALLAAADLGVPSLCLLDLPDAHMVSRVAGAPGVRAICVANGIARRMLLQCGVDPAVIHVTGNPAFDDLRQVVADQVAHYRATLMANSDTKVLVWASQPEPAIHPISGKRADPQLPAQIETYLRAWVAGRDDIRLVIRYHPSEDRHFFTQSNVYLSKREDDLRILLNSCDGLITMTSTVALQAASLGKPVLSVDLSVFTNDLPLAKLGFSKGVESMNMIPSSLDEWAAQQADVPPSLESTVGAAEAVCKVISGLLPC
jgi:hypothetical protein